MHAYTGILASVAVLVATSASADEQWVRVMSEDNKASVLFPAKPDKVEVVSRKSPAGTIQTHITRYEREGALLTINGTQLPGVALAITTKSSIRNGRASM